MKKKGGGSQPKKKRQKCRRNPVQKRIPPGERTSRYQNQESSKGRGGGEPRGDPVVRFAENKTVGGKL